MDFEKTKAIYSEIFHDLLIIVEMFNKKFEKHKNINLIKEFLENNSTEDFRSMCDGLKINLDMIDRQKMKCVFFGKTSNGKSATINAIVGGKALPSCKGRTTSCFICIEGCEEDVGYILDKNHEKQDVSRIKDLANELNSERCEINLMLKLYWPINNCRILKNSVQILDSPGVDYSKANDKWINTYCEDADVFILVVDGCSTLNESEKAFFIRVKKLISKPNMFILINKWDLVENDEDANAEDIKKQHQEEASKFLVNDLKLYNVSESLGRIFFVSALNALETDDSSMELNQFKEFEEVLETDLNINAIKTKFAPHLLKGKKTAKLFLQLTKEFQRFVYKEKPFDKEEIQQKLINDFNIMKTNLFDEISHDSYQAINLESRVLANIIKKAIETKSTNIDGFIKLVEIDLANKIGEIFETKIDNFQKKFRKMLIEHSCIKMTKNQMKSYLQQHIDFDIIAQQYKEDIKINFSNNANQIKRLYDIKGGSADIWNSFRDFFSYGPNVLMGIGLAAMRINRVAAIVLNVVSAAMSLTGFVGGQVFGNNNETENLENNINEYITKFFNAIIETLIKQISIDIEEIIEKLFDEYVEEQRIMEKLYNAFDKTGKNCQDILAKLELEKVKII